MDVLPNIWGEGAIFAFSGLDGPTSAHSRFVMTLGAKRFSFLIHTPQRRTLVIAPSVPGDPSIVTHDVLCAGDLVCTYTAWHTLAGTVPPHTEMTLEAEDAHATTIHRPTDDTAISQGQDALVLIRRGSRFALAFGESPGEASHRAEAGMAADVATVVERRLAFYRALPEDRLARKCASVMKVNTLAPELAFADYWSTPDRVPHRDMWLWDSVFHTLGMNHIDSHIAWLFLKSVLDQQTPDGMIPHQSSVEGRRSTITQPPVLGWGVWENYQHTQEWETLHYALPRLERTLEWNLQHRDRNGNRLLEWDIEENELCRSGESGMDNSPRFDAALHVDAVDFSVFQARDMGYVARIASELGDQTRAAQWMQRARQMTRQIHALLWDETTGFYYDRFLDGALTGVAAGTGFLPLLLDGLPHGRGNRLVAALNDPGRFNTAFPVPSVAVSHPDWSTDMWRGATWVNLNYLIIAGLRRYGYDTDADRLVNTTIRFVRQYYEHFGVIFEFYDAKDVRPPVDCDRKGVRQLPYDIRRKMDSIRDYHWTAALIFDLIMRSSNSQ